MRELKSIKRIVSFILAVAVVTMQSASVFANNVELIHYVAIQANKYSIDKRAEINGSIVKGDIEDYSSGIFYLFSGNDVVKDEIQLEGNSILETPMYCKNGVKINVNDFITNSMFGSQNSINIKVKK